MSCEVKCLSSVPDLPKVQEFLGFSQDENWLNTVYLSISPTNELMVFGHGCKLMFLSRTSDGTNSSYTVSWSGEISDQNEVITSLLCLPIFGHNVASGAEWTSVAVGLSSGLAVFYTDSGIQIFSQRWAQDQIISIKAYSRATEEVIQISYLKCVCILQSTHLVSVLRSQKNYYQPNEGAIGGSTKAKTDVVIVPCRKWEYEYGFTFSGSPSVNDSCLVGPQEPCFYDYLVEQCLNRGSSAKPRSAPPQNTLILAAGAKPYVGFNYAKEGYIPADLSEVAKEVASKVTNSLTSWFFKPKETKKEPEEVKEAAIPTGEKMSCRFGLCDIEREAVNLWICPFSKIAAVADNLQRVILVDCQRGIAFKMFKGYRDAQCAFIKVKEKKLESAGKRKDSSSRATALFLVAYAPKRSCLEIWVLENGPRVAAFNVSKYGQLVYNNHSLMGIPPGVKAKYTSTSCFFLDPSDCFLKEISIPFHCALSSVQSVSNSKTAKDIHFLRQLKNLLRSKTFGNNDLLEAEVKSICENVETLEIKVLCLEFMKQAKKKISPSLFYVAVKTLEGTVEKDSDFHGILNNYCKVVNFYLSDVLQGGFSEKDNEKPVDVPMDLGSTIEEAEFNELGLDLSVPSEVEKVEDSHDDNVEKLNNREEDSKAELIGKFSENDMQPLEELLSILSDESKEEINQNISKVTFLDLATSHQAEQNEAFFEFLNSFDISANQVQLNTTKEKSFSGIGEQIFVKYIRNEVDLAEFEDRARKSGISPEDFIRMIVYSWMNIDFTYSDKNEILIPMTRLGKVLKVICDLAEDKVFYNYDEICDWWQFLRELILECSCALRGLVFAIVCKHVSVMFLRKEDNEEARLFLGGRLFLEETLTEDWCKTLLMSYGVVLVLTRYLVIKNNPASILVALKAK